MRAAPLPSLSLDPVQPAAYDTISLYPIDVLSSLPSPREVELGKMVITYPVHIHTPQAHIGTVHGSHPGQDTNALDLFNYLQSLARRPLDFNATYSQLSLQMKAEVKAAFMHRNRRSSLSLKVWEHFSSGQPTRVGPTGEDLLLGNINIWGVEERSLCGCSVIHLA